MNDTLEAMNGRLAELEEEIAETEKKAAGSLH